MSDPTPVDRVYQEATSLGEVLVRWGETSLQNAVGDHFRKALLLSAASHFEHRLCTIVLDFVHESSNGSSLVEQFVKNKAISRQYHSWFQWDSNNANQFFGLFGPDFKSHMKEAISKSEELRNAIKAFLEIGNTRNRLVHQDYATFPLDKTIDEVYSLYTTALPFLDQLPEQFKRCARS